MLSLSNYSLVSGRAHEMSRTLCLRVVEEAGHYIKMLTRVTAGCDHMFKCLRVFRRTESILEIQEGSPTTYKMAACSPQNLDERLMIYTTLFKVKKSMGYIKSQELFYSKNRVWYDGQKYTIMNSTDKNSK